LDENWINSDWIMMDMQVIYKTELDWAFIPNLLLVQLWSTYNPKKIFWSYILQMVSSISTTPQIDCEVSARALPLISL